MGAGLDRVHMLRLDSRARISDFNDADFPEDAAEPGDESLQQAREAARAQTSESKPPACWGTQGSKLELSQPAAASAANADASSEPQDAAARSRGIQAARQPRSQSAE